MVASFKGTKKRLDLGMNGTSYLSLKEFHSSIQLSFFLNADTDELETPESPFVPRQNAKNLKVAYKKILDHALEQSFVS